MASTHGTPSPGSGNFPYLVAEYDGAFAGYAYASPYRSRAGYRWTVEDTRFTWCPDLRSPWHRH